jgi:hypothetical protein
LLDLVKGKAEFSVIPVPKPLLLHKLLISFFESCRQVHHEIVDSRSAFALRVRRGTTTTGTGDSVSVGTRLH